MDKMTTQNDSSVKDYIASLDEQIVQQSYGYIKSKAKDGPITQILWQTAKKIGNSTWVELIEEQA